MHFSFNQIISPNQFNNSDQCTNILVWDSYFLYRYPIYHAHLALLICGSALLKSFFSLGYIVIIVCPMFFLWLYSEPAVTFTPSYKKTPPPVPPRSVTKPIISVTAQSSTESMQDAYHEGRLPRLPRSRDVWGKYVSTESLDSAKALTLATEGRRLVSTGSYTSVQTCDKAVLVSKAEEYLKTPRSSIGIQVKTSTSTLL